MVPVRRNQNWLPSIFNDFLGNDWLAERHNTTAPAVNIIEDENEYKRISRCISTRITS